MTTAVKFFYLVVTAALLVLCGCATPDPDYDDREYSSLPWTEPWEGVQQLPGMSPGY